MTTHTTPHPPSSPRPRGPERPGTDQTRLRRLLAMQRRAVELVATDEPVRGILDAMCVEVQDLVPASTCTVMLLEGDALRVIAAPNAPETLVRSVDGLKVGQGVCGAAVLRAETTVSADVLGDESLRPFWDFARAHGVAACWSIPVISRGQVLGTFAIYLSEKGVPNDVETEILETAASIASIALSREEDAHSLRRAETTYQTIFDVVNDAIFVHDLETGGIVDVNPKMCELFECTRQEALAMNVADLGADEAHDEAVARERLRLAASGVPQLFEWNSRRPNGSSFWAEVNLKRATIAGEERVLAVVRDISQRRDAESALRESEATLRSIMESSPDFVMLVDLELNLRFINRVIEGMRMEDVLGRPLLSFLEGRFHRTVLDCFDRVLASGKPDRYEVEHIAPDGAVRVFETRVAPVKQDSSVTALALSATDVTARKAVERAVVESEARFRQLTEAIHDVFWLTDWQTRRVMYISPSYKSVWGRTCQSLLDDAKSWSQAIHPDDVERARQAFYTDAERGRYDIEYRIIQPDGAVRWIHDKAFPILGEDGRTVVRMAGVSEDVTERKLAEEELVRRSESERILRCELDHRVRNNLASLMTLIEISESVAPDRRSFVSAIKGRVNAMATIHSFLSRTNWTEVGLRDMVSALTPSDAVGRVEFEGEPVLVPAYQCNSLAVVVHELLHNSVKYGALGSRGGRVGLSRTHDTDDDGAIHLRLRWTERGGRPIETQPTGGVGTSLIDGLVEWDLGGDARFSYPRDGADHRFHVVLRPS